MNFIYVENQTLLATACNELKQASVIGVDLECENNLHHYGTKISLIQLSTTTQHWIVDVIKLKTIDPLLEIFSAPKVQKIFHDVSFDLRILHHQFGCRPKNIFDTQLAALFIGKKEIGLGPLLQEYFKIKKEQKFQMADWTKRPLTKEMLLYAIKDTAYLIALRNLIKEELIKKNRLSWVEEEFSLIEKNNWEHKEMSYSDVKGFRNLLPQERAILKRLFLLREKLAKQVDRPPHYIMSTKPLLAISQDPPKSLTEWNSLKSVHPVVKRSIPLFQEAISKGKTEQIILPELKAKRYAPEQREQLNELMILREKISKKIGIDGYLVLNQDQMQDLVLSKTHRSLHNWQEKLLQEFKKS